MSDSNHSKDTHDQWLTLSVRVLQIIVIALAAGVIGFIVFGLNNSSSKADPKRQGNLTMIGYALAGAGFVMHLVVPRIVIRGHIQERITSNQESKSAVPPFDNSGDDVSDDSLDLGRKQLMGCYQVATIIAGALLEGPAFFNVVAYTSERNIISILISLGLAGSIICYFPTVNRISGWLERKTREIESQRQFTAR
jgi:hypothetical protein